MNTHDDIPTTTFKSRIPLLITLMAASALTINAGAVIAPSLPGLLEHFRDTPRAMLLTQLVLTITSLAVALCAPLAGIFADRVGRKPLLIYSLVLCGVAGTSGLYLDTLLHLLIGRVVLGIAVAGIMTATTTLIGDYFRGTRRNFVIGLQGATLGLGGVVFLYAGGHLAEVGWRWPFTLYAIALLFVVPVLTYIREPSSRDRVMATVDAKSKHSYRTFIFIFVLYAAAVCIQIAFYTIPIHLPFYMQSVGIFKPSKAGEAMALLILCASIAALLYRPIKTHVSYTVILAFTLIGMAVGYVLLAHATSYPAILVAMIVTGSGLGFLYPNLTAWIMAHTAPILRGRIVGGLTMAFFLGQFLSPLATESITHTMGLGPLFMIVGYFLLLGAVPFGIYGLVQMYHALKRRRR